jgi:small subunit ribosomal protein S16
MGNNKKPFFRIVALDGRKKNEGRYLEMLGWYDPKVKGNNFELKMDRVNYWTGQGAILSDTVRSLVRKINRRAKAASAA